MIYYAPKYTKKFKCAASACRDSCCIGWEIAVDEDTLEKYNTAEGALFEDIRKSVTEDGCFRLTEGERCPHLLKNGLCRIICEAGEEALCEICREHPRFYNDYGSHAEWGLGLACESAAELILSEAEPYLLSKEEREGEPSELTDLYAHLFPQRQRMLVFAADESFCISSKLFLLELWASKLQYFVDNCDIGKEIFTYTDDPVVEEPFFTQERLRFYKELLLSLEPLNEDFPSRFEKITEVPKALSSHPEYGRILAYYIYRYFLLSSTDEDIKGHMGMALFCTAMTVALCESEGRHTREQILEAAKDFSKEIEYSEENAEAVTEAFSAFI